MKGVQGCTICYSVFSVEVCLLELIGLWGVLRALHDHLVLSKAVPLSCFSLDLHSRKNESPVCRCNLATRFRF